MTNSIVRIAGRADVDGIMHLCRLLHEENGVASMSDDKVRTMVDRAVARSGGVIGVIGSADAPEGCISLIFDQLWYTDDMHLSELFNFVHPDHRKSGHAKSLIQFAMRMGTELAMPVFIGVISNHRTEEKIRLYRRQLGDPAGAFFIHGQYEEAASHVR